MVAKVKLADGKYCYAGPGCRLHSPTGIEAARVKRDDALRLYVNASSLDEMGKAKEALTEASIAYDATTEGSATLQKILDTETNEIKRLEALVRLKDARAYVEKVEAEFAVEEEKPTRKPRTPKGEKELVDIEISSNLSPEAEEFAKNLTPTIIENGGYLGANKFIGAKCPEKYTSPSVIRGYIRDDIKEAQRVGYLPKNVQYSISKGGSYNSIQIEVRGVKDSSAFTVEPDPRWPQDTREVPTQNAKELRDRVQLIADSYNSDDSNSQVDYFNRSYYARVEIETERSKNYREKEARLRKDRTVGLSEQRTFIQSLKQDRKSALNQVVWSGEEDGRKIGRIPGTKLFVIDQSSKATSGVEYTYLVNMSGKDFREEEINEKLLQSWKTSRSLRSQAIRL